MVKWPFASVTADWLSPVRRSDRDVDAEHGLRLIFDRAGDGG
jgi:hypothetical protein